MAQEPRVCDAMALDYIKLVLLSNTNINWFWLETDQAYSKHIT